MQLSIHENKNGMIASAILFLLLLACLAFKYPDTDYLLETKMQYGAPGSDVEWNIRAAVIMFIGSMISWFFSIWLPAFVVGWYLLGLVIERLFVRR